MRMCLNFVLSLVFNWSSEYLIAFNASKNTISSFLQLSLFNHRSVYSLSLTMCSLVFHTLLKFLSLLSLQIFNWRILFPLLLKLLHRRWVCSSDSMSISLSCNWNNYIAILFAYFIEYGSFVWGYSLTTTAQLDRVVFLIMYAPYLTESIQSPSLFTAKNLPHVFYFIAVIIYIALWDSQCTFSPWRKFASPKLIFLILHVYNRSILELSPFLYFLLVLWLIHLQAHCV